jgi:hypothetical protein
MVKGKIKSVNKDVLRETNVGFLDVEVEIVNENDEVLSVRKLGYPLDATSEDIKRDIKNICEAYDLDLKIGAETKKAEEVNKKADETINELVGAEIE